MLCRVLVLVYVCVLVGEGEENTGFIYPRDPCPISRSILRCNHRMLDLAKFLEIKLAREASMCLRCSGRKPLLVG